MFFKALWARAVSTWFALNSIWALNHTAPQAPTEDPSTWRLTRPEWTLRRLAQRQDMYVGAAVRYKPLRDDPAYRRAVSSQFNLLVAENAMKFRYLHPKPDRYNFGRADALVAFARRHGMQVRGHTLLWHAELPDWVRWEKRDALLKRRRRVEKKWHPDALRAVMEDHIKTVVGRYRGHVQYWDVVNEAVSTLADGLRETIWQKTLGDAYIADAFRFAHAADPAAKLFYNDFLAEDLNAKSDRVYALVKELLAQEVPIHGVGLQGHMHFRPVDRNDLVANLRRFADLGLEIHLTEVDVGIPKPITPGKLKKQAIHYRRLMDACLAVDACTAFVTWGVSDAISWVPRFFPQFTQPLLLDRDFAPKPAYYALTHALATAAAE